MLEMRLGGYGGASARGTGGATVRGGARRGGAVDVHVWLQGPNDG